MESKSAKSTTQCSQQQRHPVFTERERSNFTVIIAVIIMQHIDHMYHHRITTWDSILSRSSMSCGRIHVLVHTQASAARRTRER